MRNYAKGGYEVEVLDFITKALAAVGGPTLIALWIRKMWRFWKDRNTRRADKQKERQKIPLEVRGIAATTFEAEIAALTKSFNQDRAIKDNTILDAHALIDTLSQDLQEERQRRISVEMELESVKTRLRETLIQVQELIDTVEVMSEKLAERRMEQDDEDFRLHPGSGS